MTMKRYAVLWVSILVLFTLLIFTAVAEGNMKNVVVGDSVFFGHYEQDNNTQNGDEPIEWTVLQIQDGKALMISRYALDCQPYHTEKIAVTWADSALRAWLTDSFFANAFTTEEQAAVLPVEVINDRGEGNAEWTTDGGSNTEDKVFLLSIREVGLYFQGENSYKTSGTEYARAQGAKFLGVTTIGVAETDWWLRSPGKEQSDGAFVGTLVHSIAAKQVTDKIGVRPSIWVELNADWDSFPYQQTEHASALANDGDYAGAYAMIAGLDNYRNCVEIAAGYLYANAIQAYEAGEYLPALERLREYRDYARNYSLTLEADYLTILPECYYQCGL